MREQRHRCLVPGCSRWIPVFRWGCHQHCAILANAENGLLERMQTAWCERFAHIEAYAQVRREVFEYLGASAAEVAALLAPSRAPGGGSPPPGP